MSLCSVGPPLEFPQQMWELKQQPKSEFNIQEVPKCKQQLNTAHLLMYSIAERNSFCCKNFGQLGIGMGGKKLCS